MKIIKSRLAKLPGTFFALLLLSVPAFCQPGPPPFPPIQIDHWILAQPNWLDIYGDAPLGYIDLNTAPGWSKAGTALSVDTNCPAFLDLSAIDDGESNISLTSGTISFWFQPNYTSVPDGGNGPTNWASLLTIGQWTSNAAASCWSLVIDPDGANLIFLAQSNGASQIVLTAPIDFDAGDWHGVCLTYSPTNCCLYLEGQPVTNAGPIACMPSDSDCSNYGIFVGSLSTNGECQAHGQFQDLETYDSPLSADEIAQDYADTSAIILNRGGSLPSSGGFHPDGGPAIPEGGTNSGGGGGSPQTTNSSPLYSATNFWLEPLPLGTNAYNSNTNLITFILHATTNTSSYQLQTAVSLTSTNWTPQQPFVGASGQNWTPITFPMPGQSPLFFRAINYSQDTTDSGLPDWWKLEYGLNPNSVSSGANGVSDAYSDPAGDGWTDLQKFENGWNPNTFYTPPAPTVTVAPLPGDNGVLISWEPSLGNVTGYTIYRNGAEITTVSASHTSYQDNSVSVSPYSMPMYQVQANYAQGNSSLSVAQDPQNQNMSVDTVLIRGSNGQYYLAAPNIPNTITNLRIYPEASYSEYPNFQFDIYSQPMTNFNSTAGATYLDFPSASFTNGLAIIPESFLPYYNAYNLICVPMGTNGTFGPFAYVTYGLFQSTSAGSNWYNAEISALATEINNYWGNLIPFLDGTTQLRQNLIFQLESADELNALQFSVEAIYPDPRPTAIPFVGSSDVYFLSDYAWANFHMRDGGYVPVVNEFKPFEDNYFYRNFVFGSGGDLNPNGSLVSGVHYVGGSPVPPPPVTPYNTGYYIQIPNEVPYAFPDYAFAAASATNPVSPLLSTNSQSIFSTWPGYGNVGVSHVNSTNITLATGQHNIFGLPYESVTECFSDGRIQYSQTLTPGRVLFDLAAYSNYPSYFYPQVEAPTLHTAGYFFGVDDRDYFPGDPDFTPATGTTGPIIATPGVPLLIAAWAEQSVNGGTNTPGFIEQYFDKALVVNSEGAITTNQTGLLSEYGEFFPTDPGSVVLTTKTNSDGSNGIVSVQVIGLYTDRNHDGVIDTSFGGPDYCTPSRPFQFWANDDNDSGDTGGDDVPGEPAMKHQTPNGVSGIVNGVRDLDDFFPVYVDVGPVLQQMQTNPAYASLQFRLSQGDGAINYVETTTLTTNAPLAYLTDSNQAFLLSDVVVTQATSTGVYLSDTFLSNILNGGGIILAEASTNTTSPLVLDIIQDGYILAEAQLPLNITGVEQMFRHENLTAAVLGTMDGPNNRLTSADVPNEPDNNGTNFIFVHGYNVNPYQARGSEAEMFKRLFWSGSHARFYGVTWMGYDTQRSLNPFSTNGLLETLNYQTNVFHAFQTAPAFAAFIASLNGTSVVAAHSLGNMVVLSALNDYGANVSAYFMIDAAVAIEAIDETVGVNTNMVHPQWTPYDENTWASYWYQLFSTNDYRRQLNWTGRFGNINLSQVYNFYSSGEEVLRTSPGPPPSVLTAVFDQVVAYGIFNQVPVGSYTWAWQEKTKGRCAGNWIMGSDHGGWGFNSLYGNTLFPPNASTVNALYDFQLQTNPVFDVSYDGPDLYGTNGSAYAQIYKNRILSDAIPALSLPLGANPVPTFDEDNELDMQAVCENGWASGRSEVKVGAPAAGEWHHSDYQVVAYTYTYKLFMDMVTLGNLK
jgi:hypothetical protein